MFFWCPKEAVIAPQQRNQSRQSLAGPLNQSEDVFLFLLTLSSSLLLVDYAWPVYLTNVNKYRQRSMGFFISHKNTHGRLIGTVPVTDGKDSRR